MQSWAEDQIFGMSKLHLKHPTGRAPGSGALSATAWEHDAPATWVPRNPPRAAPERKAASPHEVDERESSLEFSYPTESSFLPNPLNERLVSGECFHVMGTQSGWCQKNTLLLFIFIAKPPNFMSH